MLTLLGGVVQPLYEEWQMNQKYSGFSRSSLKLSQESGTGGPPPFEKLQIGAPSHRFAQQRKSSGQFSKLCNRFFSYISLLAPVPLNTIKLVLNLDVLRVCSSMLKGYPRNKCYFFVCFWHFGVTVVMNHLYISYFFYHYAVTAVKKIKWFVKFNSI